MNEVVLDASAIMAILDREPGAEKLTTNLLEHAVVSTVNLAEIQTVLVNRGVAPDDAGGTRAARFARPIAPGRS
jgi:PIN domain nuclease of toxin-antitoxin system